MALNWSLIVTFESDTRQPETVRDEVTGSLSAAVSRAVRLAKQQKPTRNHYESIAVLMERRRAIAQTAGTERALDVARPITKAAVVPIRRRVYAGVYARTRPL